MLHFHINQASVARIQAGEGESNPTGLLKLVKVQEPSGYAVYWKILSLVALIAFAGAVYWAVSPVFRSQSANREDKQRVSVTPAGTPGPNDPVLVGAGDISSCAQENDSLTADLLDQVVASATGEVAVFTVGDNAYENGSIEEYQQCYEPTWGRHKARTRPAPGNHEYHDGKADGYFQYYGAIAGDPAQGYYSYDLGGWHIIVLNTNDHCQAIACSDASPQATWLRSDLEAHSAFCTMAIWHDPLFSSGRMHGSSRYVEPLWTLLYAAGADLVLNAHEHNYERFAPQTPDGALDTDYGIREFVVGTGGESHYRESDERLPNSEAANDDTFGVLRLTLRPAGYDWAFMPEERHGTFSDAGNGQCHGPPPLP